MDELLLQIHASVLNLAYLSKCQSGSFEADVSSASLSMGQFLGDARLDEHKRKS